MTRINVGINPKLLTDEHLRAEHREIKRICSHFYKRSLKGPLKNIPNEFSLGAGHVTFFLDKPLFTLTRYQAIRDELIARNFNPTNFANAWDVYKGYKGNSYIPSDLDKQIIVNRIENNINLGRMQIYHYYGIPITKNDAIKILKNG
jgi:hypothetical protein